MMNFSGLVLPLNLQAPPQPTQEASRDETPARVRLAMAVWSHLTAKTAPTALPCKTMADSEVSYEPMKGQELTDEERISLNAASNVITLYLQGKLTESKLERRARLLEQEPTEGCDKPAGTFRFPCPFCTYSGAIFHTSKCPYCETKGYVMVAFSKAGMGD